MKDQTVHSKHDISAFSKVLKSTVEQVKKDYPDPKSVPDEVKEVLRDITAMGRAVLRDHDKLVKVPIIQEPPPATEDPMAKVKDIEAAMPPFDFGEHMRVFEEWTDKVAKENGFGGIGACTGGGWDEDRGVFAIKYALERDNTNGSQGSPT